MMRCTIMPPGPYGLDFGYEAEPEFWAPAPSTAFAQDPERFPRPPNTLERLGLALARARGDGTPRG